MGPGEPRENRWMGGGGGGGLTPDYHGVLEFKVTIREELRNFFLILTSTLVLYSCLSSIIYK